MATTGMLGFAIVFCFVALILVCLGFATDHWVDVTVDRTNIKVIFNEADYTTNPNLFTRSRGLFKVCYEGSETTFLDNDPDVVSGNCLWIKGLELGSDEDSLNIDEDEYDWRNHMIRAQIASEIIGMVALLGGVILASIGCWNLSPRGFRLAGLLVFIGAFFVACGMGLFHGYDYLEREKINASQQGLFPKYWDNQANVKDHSKMDYGWSYIISWVGMGLAAISAILLLCTAYYVQWDEDYNKYSEKKLKKRMRRRWFGRSEPEPIMAAPAVYGGPPACAATPVPSVMGPPPVYQQQGPAPIIEVPVEVPVPVEVDPPEVIPVFDNDAGYGYDNYGYDGYKGYGYDINSMPVHGPAGYGQTDRFWF